MERLKYFESLIDEQYNSIEMTSNNINLETWRMLTVYEDYMQFHLHAFLKRIRHSQRIIDNAYLVSELENHKLTLKMYLSLIYKKCKEKSPCKKESYFNGKNYIQISKSIKLINTYMQLNWNVISVYQNLAEFKDSKIRFIFRNHVDYCQSRMLQQYSRSDDSNLSKEIQQSSLSLLLGYIVLGVNSDIYQNCLEVSSVLGHTISYKFDQDIIDSIYQKILNSQSMDLPENWRFPWSSVSDFRRFFNSLNAICIFHFICIKASAEHYKIKGGGVDQRVISLREEDLIDRINRISGLSSPVITNIMKALTYGFNTSNPDPALQPLFVNNGEVLIAPLLITTLNYDRNALSLYLRVDDKGFSKASESFEVNMTQKFVGSIPERYKIMLNFHLPNSSGGEIDAALIDIETKTILVYELKWMLTPSDPNEVFYKIKECRKKVVQAEKKLFHAKMHIDFILDKLGIKEQDTTSWAVCAIVLIEGFSGINYPDMPQIKMLPSWVHEKVITGSHSLREFSGFILSDSWLPKERMHYKKIKHNITFAGKQISVDGMELTNIDDYLHHYIPTKLIEYRSQTNHD
ncbi:hypothetical protein EDF78_11956 [Rahnella sp. BIGb0236]|uniref:hypothetical protein n=1 Tax=Rahnella sp. BIGb0236 TaxID=2485117 RepID=UPI0010607F0A|nr:hypothetical protein [Rahnella sp. BIGb0236]TDS84906.1 hypothetical protein EDF78_11956 [Rahnella sp. BIGb0236]